MGYFLRSLLEELCMGFQNSSQAQRPNSLDRFNHRCARDSIREELRMEIGYLLQNFWNDDVAHAETEEV